jgi:aquaporin Z
VAAPLVGAVVAGLVFRSFGTGSASGGPGQSAVAAGELPNAAEELETEGPEDTGSEASEAREFFEGKRG